MVITSIGWVSRRKLGDLTLSRAPGQSPHPRPLSDLSPSPPHHPTPTAHPPAPPCHRLLCSRRLPELLHTPTVLSPRHAATCAFHSLSPSLSRASHARRCHLVGARGQPRRRLRPGCLPARRRPADAQPLHCFLSHLPRHHQPTPSITAWPGSASPGPRPTRPGRCRSPPLATRPPDSLHRPTPDAARLP
jgi:hypothetical protein